MAQVYGAALATPHSRLGRLTICKAPGFAGGCLLNSDQLRDVAIGYLRDIGGVLTQSCRGEVYEIRGHASSEGPLDLNERLARQRAEAARRWLVENYRIDADLVVMNRGISSPIRLSDGTEDYELSRRVEIVRRFSQ